MPKSSKPPRLPLAFLENQLLSGPEYATTNTDRKYTALDRERSNMVWFGFFV